MTGKPTMRKVSEGVYARVDAAGKVRGYTGYVPDASKKSGKRSIGTFSKAKQAKDARAEELGKPKGPSVHGDETVKEFRERWEREFNQDNRTVTKKGHHYALNAFVAAHGHLKLRELADKHYDEVRSWGRTATIGYVAVARKLLNDAIEDKKLARGMNPLSTSAGARAAAAQTSSSSPRQSSTSWLTARFSRSGPTSARSSADTCSSAPTPASDRQKHGA